MNHQSARAFIVQGFTSQLERAPTRSEAQCEQAVGFLETGYGLSWTGAGLRSYNWGALQGTGPAGFFLYTDTHPNLDGTSTPYQTKFCKYSTDAQGAAALTREVYQTHDRAELVLLPATAGDTLGFSTGLHTSGYYEGFGATVEERIEHHHASVLNACRLMALELGEPMPDGSAPLPLPLAALHQGSMGEAVEAWQHTLIANGYACAVDGVFGPTTRTLTLFLQKKLGVAMDGVVGPATLAAAAPREPPATENNS
jgi:hypothetical protein